MANLNKVMLIGNLTRDPEIRQTSGGTAVAEFGLAMNRKYKQGEELKEETTFVDITLWQKQAETAEKYLKKGSPVYIEGRLKLDTWDDKKTGEKRSKLTVVGENFQLLGGKPEGGDSGKGANTSAGKPKSKQAAADSGDDDIPF